MATIQGKFVNDSGLVVFEGSLITDGAFDVTTPDVGSTETADSITIEAGSSATPGSGTGGSVTIQPGDGDTAGEVRINDAAGDTQVQVSDSGNVVLGGGGGDLNVGTAPGLIGFFGHAPVARPAAPVLLSDVIAALKTLGLVAT